MARADRRLRVAAALLATLVIAGCTCWGALALWYQAPGGPALKISFLALWAAVGLACAVALWMRRVRLGLLGFALAFGGLIVWWHGLAPSNDRLWADDVARITSGTVEGNRVTMHNVRNFMWRSDTDYMPRWETRSYDLDRLKSVDMILSYWGSPAIAHLMVSFGFDGGDYLAYSVEIRRERHENFSEIGGFFKEFELSIIAADERDIVQVRTNVRDERDYLYHIRLPALEMRSLFLTYIDVANRLVRHPRFYNTVTANCTTLVYHMLKRIVGHLPVDYRVLFSGYLPEYVYSIGGLDNRYPLEELRSLGYISERAKRANGSADFSAAIRQGVPPLN
ncbi:MAG TPA: DUF4105 domain-containing protein [Steroidobacteraceae bacterium]|nr:DUF4105 domain-containing protein [Steroidobacteraceae bacterium]